MPARRAPSITKPPDALNRTADTGRAELADALMMSLSRVASPSASSPFTRTIVLFSRETVVVSSAADAAQHVAATHAKANTPLNIINCPASSECAPSDQLHPLVGAHNACKHFAEPRDPVAVLGKAVLGKDARQRLTVSRSCNSVAIGYAQRRPYRGSRALTWRQKF